MFVLFLAAPAAAQSVTAPAPAPNESAPRSAATVNLVNAEVGASYVSTADPPDGGGVMLGVGAGVRLDLWSFGARVRVHPQPDFTMVQLLAEAGIHPLHGRWDPYAKLRAGYVTVGATRSRDPADSPNGLNLALALGCDYSISRLVSLGFDATYEILLFARSLGWTQLAASETGRSYEGRPGYALVGSLHMGLSFDL